MTQREMKVRAFAEYAIECTNTIDNIVETISKYEENSKDGELIVCRKKLDHMSKKLKEWGLQVGV